MAVQAEARDRLKAVIAGYFGFGNVGDDLLFLAAVGAVRRRVANAEITVLANSPAAFSRNTGARAVSMWNPVAVWRAIRSSDRLLFGGGGIFQDRTSRRSLAYYLCLIAAAQLAGKPVGLCNVGIDPVSSPRLSRWMRRLLARAASPITVRDESSALAAAAAGLGRDRVKVTADGVFAFDPPAGVAPVTDALLVVRTPPPGVSTIVLPELARRLATSPLSCSVAAFQPGEDADMAEAVARGARLRAAPAADASTAVATVASARRVISARYHALVLAAMAGRPFLGVGDPGKIRSLCRQFDMPYLEWTAGADRVGAAYEEWLSAPAPDGGRLRELRLLAESGFDVGIGVAL